MINRLQVIPASALLLFIAACGSTGTTADESASTVVDNPSSIEASVPLADSDPGTSVAELGVSDLQMGGPEVDVRELSLRMRSLSEAMEESFAQPYDLQEFVDVVGFGTVEAVRDGRRYIRNNGSGEFARTTLVVKPDKLMKGEADTDGLVYVEFTHAPQLTSTEIARGLPAGSRVLFFASDVSDFRPNDAELFNWDGGRPRADQQAIYVTHTQGLWLEYQEMPWSLLEPADLLPPVWRDAAQVPWRDFESKMVSLTEKRVDEPVEELCIDFTGLDVSSITGIDDQLRTEISSVIAADECITETELADFFEKYPELREATLGE